MRILHSSDWHIGRYLYERKRYEEFEAFFEWLLEQIEILRIDVLLVAGDIFDVAVPNNRAQQIYYHFLAKLNQSCCQHAVIIAGNHDSPSFISASKEVLKSLRVHVVGTVTENIADEIISVYNAQDELELLVCAVPYLRDKDVRKVQAAESIEDKSNKLIIGIKEHYHAVTKLAVEKREVYYAERGTDKKIPILGMGHLFAAGGSPGEGVRDLYVGSLGYINQEVFPVELDYVALGHLHIAQKVAGLDKIRYCGSPLAMGFAEAKQEKKLLIIDFDDRGEAKIEELIIPKFQRLEKVLGDEQLINSKISEFISASESIWLEVEYSGNGDAQSFRKELLERIDGSQLELLRFKNTKIINNYLEPEKVGDAVLVHELMYSLERYNPDKSCGLIEIEAIKNVRYRLSSFTATTR